MAASRTFGDGMLFRVATYCSAGLGLTVMFALSNVLFIPAVLLAHDVSNAPLFALAAVPLGPALTALLSSVSRLLRTHELSPVRDYVRFFRAGARESFALWVPTLVVAVALAINLSIETDALGEVVKVAALVLAIVVALWITTALVIVSRFTFRTRDTARLALYYLGRRPMSSLGRAAMLFVLGWVIVNTFDAVALVVSVPAAALLLATSRPMLDDIHARFVRRQLSRTPEEAVHS